MDIIQVNPKVRDFSFNACPISCHNLNVWEKKKSFEGNWPHRGCQKPVSESQVATIFTPSPIFFNRNKDGMTERILIKPRDGGRSSKWMFYDSEWAEQKIHGEPAENAYLRVYTPRAQPYSSYILTYIYISWKITKDKLISRSNTDNQK